MGKGKGHREGPRRYHHFTIPSLPSFIASQSPTFLWLILSALHSPSPRLTPRLAHSVGQEERSGT